MGEWSLRRELEHDLFFHRVLRAELIEQLLRRVGVGTGAEDAELLELFGQLVEHQRAIVGGPAFVRHVSTVVLAC